MGSSWPQTRATVPLNYLGFKFEQCTVFPKLLAMAIFFTGFTYVIAFEYTVNY
jgi:hypothetical protein